jgi:hypothetical protein
MTESELDRFFGPKPDPQPAPDPQPDPGIYEGVKRPNRRRQYARRWYQNLHKENKTDADKTTQE